MGKANIKSAQEIEYMREGGKILATIIKEVGEKIAPGVTTLELDEYSIELCKKYNVKPAFLGYMGYPNALCVAVNDEVVHGIPNQRKIKEGDIVSIDMGVVHKGLITDHAKTVAVGDIPKVAEKLMRATEDAMYAGIDQAIDGNRTGDIGHAMQTVIERAGFNVSRDLVGHGVGFKVHEEPQIPGYGTPNKGDLLRKDMTIAIEAIVTEGDWEIEFDQEDGWTTRTMDGRLACLFEHTLVVGNDEPEILTLC